MGILKNGTHASQKPIPNASDEKEKPKPEAEAEETDTKDENSSQEKSSPKETRNGGYRGTCIS